MTNRKDLIDEALLRPGRFEVHMEIGLPDEKGRGQIFRIHTKKMRENNFLGDDVDLNELAHETKNFSGAEIQGIVKSATSFALNRQLDVTAGVKVKEGEIKVTMLDFRHALGEVKPAFGVDEEEIGEYIRNGIIAFSPKVTKLQATLQAFIDQVRNSSRTPLVSVLLEGGAGVGKTAIAAATARDSGYPYVKLITPDDLVGYSEAGKAARITKVFEDAYKSPISCIVVDDIERLLDYVRLGPRFSNTILQTLLVLLKREPPRKRKLLIIGTTSNKRVLEDMEFMNSFHATLSVPEISTADEFRAAIQALGILSGADLERAVKSFRTPIAIKKLIMIAEMSSSGQGQANVESFVQALVDNS